MKSKFFDKYVIGEGNKLTHAVLETVIEEPLGKSYNPVIISGPFGIGKTYSARKAADAFQKQGRNVCLTTCEDIVLELLEDIQYGMNKQYREKYVSADVVIINNIEILEDGYSTQSEFFSLTDEIIASGKLLIMTISVPEKENQIPDWMNWYERYPWRIYTEMYMPDFEMKQKILQQMIKDTGNDIPADVVEYLAHYCSDLRRLEGAFHSLMARKTLLDEEITIELAHNIFKENR